jgi:hypothetical protein
VHGAASTASAESATVVPLVEAKVMSALTKPCPCCGTLVTFADMSHAQIIEARVEILRSLCVNRGWRIVAGDLVSEAVAADLLGKSKGHLRNLRVGTRPIPCRLVMGGWMYALGDLAAVLENSDEK